MRPDTLCKVKESEEPNTGNPSMDNQRLHATTQPVRAHIFSNGLTITFFSTYLKSHMCDADSLMKCSLLEACVDLQPRHRPDANTLAAYLEASPVSLS